MATVEFAFGVKEEVTIKRTQVPGTVKGLFIDEDGIRFFVEYADDRKQIHSEYFREDDLEHG